MRFYVLGFTGLVSGSVRSGIFPKYRTGPPNSYRPQDIGPDYNALPENAEKKHFCGQQKFF